MRSRWKVYTQQVLQFQHARGKVVPDVPSSDGTQDTLKGRIFETQRSIDVKQLKEVDILTCLQIANLKLTCQLASSYQWYR